MEHIHSIFGPTNIIATNEESIEYLVFLWNRALKSYVYDISKLKNVSHLQPIYIEMLQKNYSPFITYLNQTLEPFLPDEKRNVSKYLELFSEKVFILDKPICCVLLSMYNYILMNEVQSRYIEINASERFKQLHLPEEEHTLVYRVRNIKPDYINIPLDRKKGLSLNDENKLMVLFSSHKEYQLFEKVGIVLLTLQNCTNFTMTCLCHDEVRNECMETFHIQKRKHKKSSK